MAKQVGKVLQWLGFEFILTVRKNPENFNGISVLHWFKTYKHPQVLCSERQLWLGKIRKLKIFVFNRTKLFSDPFFNLFKRILTADNQVHNVCRVILLMKVQKLLSDPLLSQTFKISAPRPIQMTFFVRKC